MSDQDFPLIEAVSACCASLAKKEKGLKSKIIINLYGLEHNYVYQPYQDVKGTASDISFPAESSLFASWHILNKRHEDWEVYLLYTQNGTLEGFHPGTFQSSKNFDLDKKHHYIHILLPEQFHRLREACELSYPGLQAIDEVFNEYPVCSILREFYLTYLRATYQSTKLSDVESMKKQLQKEKGVLENHLPAAVSPSKLEAFFEALDKNLEVIMGERRPSLYEIKEGKLLVYDGKSRKDARLINHWIYPEEQRDIKTARDKKDEKEEEDRMAAPDELDRYEQFRRSATFQQRTEYLIKLIKNLLGPDYDDEYIQLLASYRLGKVQDVVNAADRIARVGKIEAAPDVLNSYLALLTRANTYLLKSKRYPKMALRFGYTVEKIDFHMHHIGKKYHEILPLIPKGEEP